MTQPQDKMRAEFEAWYARRFPDPRHENATWDHAEKMDALEVWQAACAQQSAKSQQDALDAARINGVSWDSGFLTVVYKGVEPGPEAHELCAHPKVSAMSWSHAINDRDAAIATQGASNV